MAKPNTTPAKPATPPTAAQQLQQAKILAGVMDGVAPSVTVGLVTPAPNAAPTNSALAVLLKPGKPYNVRPGTQQDNARSWAAVQACLATNGGQATVAQLQAAVAPYNHVPFIAYAMRRTWLVPVPAKAPATTPAVQPAATV